MAFDGLTKLSTRALDAGGASRSVTDISATLGSCAAIIWTQKQSEQAATSEFFSCRIVLTTSLKVSVGGNLVGLFVVENRYRALLECLSTVQYKICR